MKKLIDIIKIDRLFKDVKCDSNTNDKYFYIHDENGTLTLWTFNVRLKRLLIFHKNVKFYTNCLYNKELHELIINKSKNHVIFDDVVLYCSTLGYIQFEEYGKTIKRN